MDSDCYLEMETTYVVALWMLGVILVAAGWYLPSATIIVWLGALTLAFGALLAFRRT